MMVAAHYRLPCPAAHDYVMHIILPRFAECRSKRLRLIEPNLSEIYREVAAGWPSRELILSLFPDSVHIPKLTMARSPAPALQPAR
jgi:hypothetical protein